jgi:hypothetical protein
LYQQLNVWKKGQQNRQHKIPVPRLFPPVKGGLPAKKALAAAGPLERLFGSPVAAVLDFFMLAAHKGQYYLEAEVAGYVGLQPSKARLALSNLQKIGIVQQSIRGRKKASRWQIATSWGLWTSWCLRSLTGK